jgi:hypothetical protein
MSKPILIEVAPGELLDKMSILEIKLDRITDPAKRANVGTELALLKAVRDESVSASTELDALYRELRSVNETLWDIEDDIRDEERARRFEARFIELARSVYVVNDKRALIKRQINTLLESNIFEEKSYADYA